MATKTLTITEDVYQRLALRKGRNESFSDVIVKHFPRHSLMEIAGIFSHDEAERLHKRIADSRALSWKRRELLMRRMR